MTCATTIMGYFLQGNSKGRNIEKIKRHCKIPFCLCVSRSVMSDSLWPHGLYSLPGSLPSELLGKPILAATIKSGASLVARMLKYLPTMQETQVRSLGWQDPLEKGMATHSSILAWRITWEFRTEKPGRFQPRGWQSQTWWRTNTHTHTHSKIYRLRGL